MNDRIIYRAAALFVVCVSICAALYSIVLDKERLPSLGTVNVRTDEGATANDVADDGAAIVRAIQKVDRMGGGVVSFPPGRYYVSSRLKVVVSNKVSIVGAGRGATTLTWKGSEGGIDMTFSSQYNAPSFKGLTLRTTVAGGGTALKIQSPVMATTFGQGVNVEDIEIGGSGESAAPFAYWTGGIHLLDCWYPSLRRVNIVGDNSTQTAPYTMSFGVKYERTQVLYLSDALFLHMQDGVLQAGDTYGEGLNVDRFEFVGVARGFNLNGGVAINGIHNGHINADLFGITAAHMVGGKLSNLLIYKNNRSSQDFIGINLTNVYNYSITGLSVFDPGPDSRGSTTGIKLTGAAFGTIVGVSFDYFSTPGIGIVLGTAAHDNVIVGVSGGQAISAINTVVINSDSLSNTVQSVRAAGAGTAVINNAVAPQSISGISTKAADR